MTRKARDYTHLLGRLNGISDVTLKAHFELYEGYVKALNGIEEKLKGADRDEANYSYGEFSELKRRMAVPFNGMALHELYFDNLGKTADAGPDGAFEQLATRCFGSFDAWLEDAKGTALGTNGWMITALDLTTGRLDNLLLSEHHVGWTLRHLPVLVLDTWEHAFYKDFGTKRKDYVDCFFDNLNWGVCLARLEAASRLAATGEGRASHVTHAQFR